MTLRIDKKDVLNLKNQLLNPETNDKEGRTVLDIRADKNTSLSRPSESKTYEETLVIELLKSLPEFDGPQISRLINYVNRSGFSQEKIAIACLDSLKHDPLNAYQITELVRYVLSIIPDKIDVDLIQQGLANIKPVKPWLYTEILSLKTPYMALEYAIYLLQSNQFNSSSFVKLFLKWVEIKDLSFLKTFAAKLYPLLKDHDAIKIVDYKFEEKGISNLLQHEPPQIIRDVPQSYILTSSDAFQSLKKDSIAEVKRKYIPEYAT